MHFTVASQRPESIPSTTVAGLWKTENRGHKQRLANGCFLAKLLILLFVSAKKADTIG
jgi:hypothetical protein